jgi:hypothetical protein
MPRIALLLTPVLLASLLFVSKDVHAQSPYAIFRGETGGGTIEISLTPSLSSVTGVRLDGLQFLPAVANGCGATSTVMHFFDPPVPVGADGGFSLFVLPAGTETLTDGVHLTGTVVSAYTVEGEASYTIEPPSAEAGCTSQPLSWNAGGPIDSPPYASDVRLAGSVLGTTGTIELTLDHDTKNLTSMTLHSLTANCTLASPVDAFTFYDPPVPLISKLGTTTIPIVVSNGADDPSTLHGFVFTPTAFTPEHIEGTAFYLQTDPLCQFNDLPWSVEIATPTPQPTPRPTTRVTSTSTPQPTPVGLPDSGAGPPRASLQDWSLLLVLGAVALASGVAVVAARRR